MRVLFCPEISLILLAQKETFGKRLKSLEWRKQKLHFGVPRRKGAKAAGGVCVQECSWGGREVGPGGTTRPDNGSLCR